MKERFGLLLSLMLVFSACKKKEETITISPEDYHSSVDKVTEVMIHDIFSPPVASRIFAYPNVAAYEILALKNDDYQSLSNQVHGLTEIPTPQEMSSINFELSALIAHMDLSRRLIFSEDRIKAYQDSLYSIWAEKNERVFNASKVFGLQVADHVQAWMDKDNYKQTRTMPKFTVNSEDPSRWQPTPPAYMSGIEPHWNKIRPFVIDSAGQFKPTPPPPFSMEEGSDFYKEVKEVYDISQEITAKGDESEEVAIAKFWDCNPYVSHHKGHVMFATKKITPGGHWVGICKTACKKANADIMTSADAYVWTAISLADAFISCWDEKYRSNLVRPETVINTHIDEEWKPFLQTPPFPEYTSGHSVISRSAATALTHIFGDNFNYIDSVEVIYGMPPREFDSFFEASDEAAVSRLYGGIHYGPACFIGVEQGGKIGEHIISKIKTKKDRLSMK